MDLEHPSVRGPSGVTSPVRSGPFIERFLEGPNQPVELVVHVLFGHLLTLAFSSFGTRRVEPVLDLTASTASDKRRVPVGT